MTLQTQSIEAVEISEDRERASANGASVLTRNVPRDTGNGVRRILVLSSSFPSRVQPVHGVFVKERVRFVSQLPNIEVRVVSPLPYFPPLKWFKRWYPLSQIDTREVVDGLSVVRPRYFLPPEIGGYFHPQLMYPAVRRAVKRIQQGFDFDVIDAHFIYADGVVATMLGRHFNKPVVITCRGEDIERFPDLPLIGNRIRKALHRATQLVAVSRPIARAMERNGADPAKITLIPNGVDSGKFHPIDKELARRELSLHSSRRIILAVGYRLEVKGFHILIDAIPRLKERFPDIQVVIVGGEARWGLDCTKLIEERIRANNVADCVFLAGPRPPEELPKWYSAADLLVILSSREGSPNVLLEALSCGLPAVATSVGGIPDVLSDSRLGLLLPERSAHAAAVGITQALSQKRDRGVIRRLAEQWSWQETAVLVNKVFDRALAASA